MINLHRMLRQAILFQFRDKQILAMSIVPVIISGLLLMLLGGWGFAEATANSRDWLLNFFSSNHWLLNSLLWMIGILVVLCFYFVSSFVFLLLVSLFSCLFSDLISARVEHLMIGENSYTFQQSFRESLSRLKRLVKNEVKKIFFILMIIAASIFFGMSAFLSPIAFYLTWSIAAIQFLDYSWCRHEMSFADCVNSFKEHWIMYPLLGLAMGALLALPFVGILFFSFSNIFFTVVFVSGQFDERTSDG